QFLPRRSRTARYTSAVKASSLTATPTVTSAAEPTSPAVASITTRVVSNRPAATATSHSQKEARSCFGGRPAAGKEPDTPPRPGLPGSKSLVVCTSVAGSRWGLGAVMPLTFLDWRSSHRQAIGQSALGLSLPDRCLDLERQYRDTS